MTSNGTDSDKVVNEWTKLKMRIYDSGECINTLNWEDFLRYHTDFPNFFTLVDFLLSIPSSSVDAERGLSRMKFVKNDWRSRLGEKNLTDIMLLYMESLSISEFQPDDAVHLWYTSGQRSRRPNYMDDIMNCSEPKVIEDKESVENLELDEEGDWEGVSREYTDKDDSDEEEMNLNFRDMMTLQKKQYQMFCDIYQFS